MRLIKGATFHTYLYSLRTRITHRGYAASRTGFNDYNQAREEFKSNVPKSYNFSIDCFDVIARKKPNSTALWLLEDAGSDRKYSYSQLSELSKKLANGLESCGLKRGDRVLAILPRIVEWWILNLACIRAGVVLCPGTTLLTQKDIALRLEKSAATAVIVHQDLIDVIEKVTSEKRGLTKICVTNETCRDGWLNLNFLMNKGSPNHKHADTLSSELMHIYFTSGTTGTPKMTPQTHASYGLGHYGTGRYWLDLTDQDVMWCNADTGWAKIAYSGTFGPWSQGSTVFVHNTKKFDPELTLKVLSDYPITTFCTAPTGYRFIVQQNLEKYKMNALSHAVSAAEPLNPEVMDIFESGTGVPIREGYGQTETGLACGTFKCIETKQGSMGKASPGFDMCIVDNDGVRQEPYAEGNLAISISPRPIALFSGYLDDEERNDRVFVGDYYLTGDRAYQDEDEYFWFVGRADDVILSAGYRIGPFEVESALQEHPAVLESAVVSSPDSLRGEVVKAFVVLNEQAMYDNEEELKMELQDHVKQTTAPYKYPRLIEFVKDLPKTVSGKTRRVELREREWKNIQS